MTITQLIQNSPANANELFAKLAATGDGAAKTRDSLFAKLKDELDLQARLEEEHLFPVLRKHAETKELVRAALDGNKRTRAMLAELDGTPREGEGFLGKVEELRKAFQQHVRDEKKELLPAVKAALSKEEAEAVTAGIEAGMETVEQQRRDVASERRAAAQREREETERREADAKAEQRRVRQEAKRRETAKQEREQRARDEEKRQQAELRAAQRKARQEAERLQEEADAAERRARETAESMARSGETLLRNGQSLAVASSAAAAESTAQTSQQVAGLVGDAVERTADMLVEAVQTYSDTTQPMMDGVKALAGVAPVALDAAAETRQVWFDWMSRSAETRSRRSRDLINCVMPQQVAQVQSRFLGETMQAWLDANARMLDISMDAYRGLAERAGQQPERQQAGHGES